MKLVFTIIVLLTFASCKSLNEIEQLPKGQYHVSTNDVKKIDPSYMGKIKLKFFVRNNDSAILFYNDQYKRSISLDSIVNYDLLLRQRQIDLDIFTIPFKIRPSVKNFPPQLNPNFSAALYLGRRHNYYKYRNTKNEGAKLFTRGIGYGIFAGVGAVTMNPYVTNRTIDYEYDGMVVNTGGALIYDAKKFNLGLAVGTDILLDKNRKSWLYQKKPWLGILFGIDLN
jgi:hypothetical protein